MNNTYVTLRPPLVSAPGPPGMLLLAYQLRSYLWLAVEVFAAIYDWLRRYEQEIYFISLV